MIRLVRNFFLDFKNRGDCIERCWVAPVATFDTCSVKCYLPGSIEAASQGHFSSSP